MSVETLKIDGDEYIKTAQTEEIPEGRGIAIDVDGIEIAIFNADGEFYAISNRCSHQSAPMCKAGEEKINAEHTWTKTRGRVDAEDCSVTCPWHLWKWDLESGKNEASGQRIATFDVTVEDDSVFVRI
ncbi:nitrite reductase (NADH) small subunit [Halopenitus malekzadehii]|uniref:Nitrite reductase (NADH) small subunit n=1 Tax=Halopenitus malekzadehii TaxID=1267564 RepID=A0A1H6JUD6_9EURY|nr:Rieske 2Fe-2S domain-containing protein [Halopenitus malekzadehii]SEH64210.1 nitrite reductase (NADH) small subunit [Halopenitus malekzadehii]